MRSPGLQSLASYPLTLSTFFCRPSSVPFPSSLQMRGRVQGFLNEKKYYEAQQLYVMQINRLTGKKQYDEAISLCLEGAKVMFEGSDSFAGGEIAILAVRALTRGKIPVDESRIQALLQLSSAFPPEVEHKEPVDAAVITAHPHASFLKACIQWSVDCSPGGALKYGEPRFHADLARVLLHLGDGRGASAHFVKAHIAEEHASIVVESLQDLSSSEREAVVARTVLQYLAVENLKGANTVFATYCKKYADSPHVATLGEGSSDNVIEFLSYLLHTCERDAPALFQKLRHRYTDALSGQEAAMAGLGDLLDRVGGTMFGLPMPKSALDMLLG